ncbi:MAG: hypothetical protein A3G76_06470 [Acidobacteria bacterium RIFCSPLOWO2_12_FULL_65_11]|nr:MAG: hypothetical protein A3H95_18185 [Acidobacteria bacterium RIFCSPLOWO2_02_FULL_64_15]OFW33185.1 MAG: hypothetical protein A3G76_06470 [Acidobacteria bacterium RIFCSPLOWO2_12_FULL_65_11]
MALTRIITATMFLLLTVSLAQAQSAGDTLSQLQKAVACAPPPAFGPSPIGLPQIKGGQDTVPRTLFGAGDLFVIGGGATQGLQIGQRYFVRRPMAFAHGQNGNVPMTQTLGWVRMVAINEDSAVALVDIACESMSVGDYLEPFVAPMVPPGADSVDTSGSPDFASAAQVVFGKDRRRTGVAGDFMLIDRGSSDGVTVGTRMAVYRDLATALPLAVVGEAMVISTAETTSLVRITMSRSAVETGDYVVPRKP